MLKIIEIRADMARRGWHTEDRLGMAGWGDNGPGYSIWFTRYNWHGVPLGNSICFHGSTTDLSQVATVVVATAKVAQEAWDTFTDSVPHYDCITRRVSEDRLLTRAFREAKAAKAAKPA